MVLRTIASDCMNYARISRAKTSSIPAENLRHISSTQIAARLTWVEHNAQLGATLRQHLVENLPDCAVPFLNCDLVIHHAGEVCIGKGDSSEGHFTKNVSRGRLAVFAEEESGLRIHVGMAPTVQNNSGNVVPRVEA